MVIQLSAVDPVHWHSVNTLTLPEPPVTSALAEVAESVELQLPSRVRFARARPPVSRQKRLCQRKSNFCRSASWVSLTLSPLRLTTNVGMRKTRSCPLYAGLRAPLAAMIWSMVIFDDVLPCTNVIGVTSAAVARPIRYISSRL